MKKILLIIVGAFIAGIIMAFGVDEFTEYLSATNAASAEAHARVEDQPISDITYRQAETALNASDDPQTTELQRKESFSNMLGKRVQWEGTISSIDQVPGFETIDVFIHSSEDAGKTSRDRNIYIVYPPEYKQTLLGYSIGQRVIVNGKIKAVTDGCIRLLGEHIRKVKDGDESTEKQ